MAKKAVDINTEADFRILLGSYDRLLYGLDATFCTGDSPQKIDLKLSIAYAAHISCIKALATNHSHLASGSTDEVIKLYDLKKKKELGYIHAHTGTITALEYHRQYLLSGSSDGCILLYRTKDYEELQNMKSHDGAVHDIAIHPSGKIALSIGEDNCVKMWDLMKGRCSYSIRARKEDTESNSDESDPSEQRRILEFRYSGKLYPEKVKWNSVGTLYGILFQDRIEITDLNDSETCIFVKCPKLRQKFLDFTFLKDESENEYIVTASEDGALRIWPLSYNKSPEHRNVDLHLSKSLKAHNNRIKSIQKLTSNDLILLVSASSSGEVKIWDSQALLADASENCQDEKPLASYSTGSRLTCLAIQIKEKLNEDTNVAR